jgi:hypothetical protein
MDAFTTRVNNLSNYTGDEDNPTLIDLLMTIAQTDVATDKDVTAKFWIVVNALKNPRDYAYDVIVSTSNVAIVETMLSAIRYSVDRPLNKCLSIVKDMGILGYLLSHPMASFHVGYKSFRALRIAVLNNDLCRVSTFLTSSKWELGIHAAAMDTMQKSSVEIAVQFNHNAILNMFIDHGFECRNDRYSDNVNKYVCGLISQRIIQKGVLIDKLASSIIHHQEVNHEHLTELYRYETNRLKYLADAALLIDNLTNVATHCRHTKSPSS